MTSSTLVNTAALLLLVTSTGISAEEWSLQPLGAPVYATSDEAPPARQQLKSRYHSTPLEGPPFYLLQDNTPALLVIPDADSELAQESAQEAAALLQSTLRSMSGVEFPLCHEGEIKQMDEGVEFGGRLWPRVVWIGDTVRAKQEKIAAEDLRPDGFRMRAMGTSLFLIGNDGKLRKAYYGTRNAAIDLLERHLGVRWLWPGELGMVIPKASVIIIPPSMAQDEPLIPKRTIRNLALGERERFGLGLIGGEEGRFQAGLVAAGQWLERQKTGSSLRLRYHHVYEDWYEKYGEKHPDWFSLQGNGTRIQEPLRPRLCKSNPAVAHQAALQALEFYAKNPETDSASISPNDGARNSFCMCPECRKLDPANGKPVTLIFFDKEGKRLDKGYPSLSDRVATFYNRVAEEVVKAKPDARLGAYAYSAYRDAPLKVTLHPSIAIGFVGFSYFDDAERKRDRAAWDGWCQKASQLFWRPNLFHVGYSVPAVYVHRLQEDLQHCYQTGMIATDFDSLLGDWSTQGLNYYVLAKLLWDPSAEVDAIVRDYCTTGFGAGAPFVLRYFLTLEKATTQIAALNNETGNKQLREEEQNVGKELASKGWSSFRYAFCKVYTPEFIESLRSFLRDAETAAIKDKRVVERVLFLKTGLDYAEKQAALYRSLLDGKEAKKEKSELLAWYRETFKSQPFAINSANRLFRDQSLFKNIE